MKPDDEIPHPAVTSVPRWPASVPRLDAGARRYLLIEAAAAGTAEVVRQWRDQLGRCRVPFRIVGVDAARPAAQLRSDLDAAVSDALVGDRLAVAGEEAAVTQLAAQARARGYLDREITVHVLGTGRILVRCAHCSARTPLAGRPGDSLFCGGCGLELEVFPHFNRSMGAYLGATVAGRDRRRAEQRS